MVRDPCPRARTAGTRAAPAGRPHWTAFTTARGLISAAALEGAPPALAEEAIAAASRTEANIEGG